MMMSLGFFVFERRTTPYQAMEHQKSWRHPDNARVGARPTSQFTGVDNEFITLTGELRPEVTGGQASLNELTKMADKGESYPLIDGSGSSYGYFAIVDFSESKADFFKDGKPRSISFTMKLKRTDDAERDTLTNSSFGGLGTAAKILGAFR